jgi:predicted GH43/DUF377 family glycosyl hydrolase
MRLIRLILKSLILYLAALFWYLVYNITSLFFKHSKRPKFDYQKCFGIDKNVTNPVLSPGDHDWEAEGVFNPAVLHINNRVHLLYRAQGRDGISRIGYASSSDGINFDERLPYPIYTPKGPYEIANEGQVVKAMQKFDPNYRSGGGWCGAEDPRAVYVAEDKTIYLTYVAFAGWDSIRIGAVSIALEDFLAKRWNWSRPVYLTNSDTIAKSGSFFPERINNKLLFSYRVFHNYLKHPAPRTHFASITELGPRTKVADSKTDPFIQPEDFPKVIRWYSGKPSFGSPPIKTRLGWLVIQVSVAGRMEWPGSDLSCYRLGAILLDLNDPTKVLHQTNEALIEPEHWYENDWKPGVVYCCGATVKDNKLLIYYGGGDKHTALATANYEQFLNALETEMKTDSDSASNLLKKSLNY